MPLTWTEELSVHVLAIDEDHRELIRTMNDLDDAIASGHGTRILGSILGRMADYAGCHFSREEEVMRRYGYPGLEDHMDKHAAFLELLSHLVYQFEMKQANADRRTADSLGDWFREHIRNDDRAFGVFLLDVIRAAGGSARHPPARSSVALRG